MSICSRGRTRSISCAFDASKYALATPRGNLSVLIDSVCVVPTGSHRDLPIAGRSRNGPDQASARPRPSINWKHQPQSEFPCTHGKSQRVRCPESHCQPERRRRTLGRNSQIDLGHTRLEPRRNEEPGKRSSTSRQLNPDERPAGSHALRLPTMSPTMPAPSSHETHPTRAAHHQMLCSAKCTNTTSCGSRASRMTTSFTSTTTSSRKGAQSGPFSSSNWRHCDLKVTSVSAPDTNVDTNVAYSRVTKPRPGCQSPPRRLS